LGVTLYVAGILGRDPYFGLTHPVQLLMAVERGFLAWNGNWPDVGSHSQLADQAGDIDTRAVQLGTVAPAQSRVKLPSSGLYPRYLRFLNGDLVLPSVWKLIQLCLDPDPEKRPTASELVNTLRKIDGGELIVDI
jgi:serine/threonine protein kinase